jgi:4-hydroxy-4-methyl-2-oxoglutarate aldolase
MPMLPETHRQELLLYDTCKIANAIEVLKIRQRNEGFTHAGLRCVTGGFPAILGHAVTSKVKCADPPMKGYSTYDLCDWWEVIATRPSPRIAVIEDIDESPGQGGVLSDVHAEVLRALGCLGVVTNGAVRNIPLLAHLQFPAFCKHVTVSHSYVHLVDYGIPVEILGLTIAPGDLIYADVHGVISIPAELVSDILRVARECADRERTIIDLCRSDSFSFDALRKAARAL